jgi:hypothetical protein
MPKCCSDKLADLVVAPKGDKRCKVNPGALKNTFNSYVLNKQQVAKKNNTIDYEDDKALKKMGNAAVRWIGIFANYL